ncbi:MFS transporter [Streptomyces triticagri]|uniref:MFS transporter n=1 Tax=Streptomyces triticagri TaxID=2293568 RepID=A0A372M8A1_9ACTN|nr:MFS transporter [Streptomyces triticagri]RFU87166.1 MFS transporter [Streptomyces triticagri]
MPSAHPAPAASPRQPAPVDHHFAVAGDVLIAADRSGGSGHRPERPRRSPFAPYRRLFAVPGTRAFTLGNLLARLPMGMFTVSAVIMIAAAHGSYALAGAVTATGLAATAFVAPWTARLVDRYGQARVALPATAIAALGSLALVLCVRSGAPAWTLFLCYAATATTPNTGGMARARWRHLFRDDPAARHTANSFEQAADELCFMLGPVLAAFLCTALFPEAGTLTGVALLLAGMALFTAQRSTEPPVRRPASRTESPVRAPGMLPLLAVFLATGAVFGSLEVITVAYADDRGHPAAAGLVLGLQAAGSGAAGLVLGTLSFNGPLHRRLRYCLLAMTALMTLPLAAATTGSLPVLGCALLIAGIATAPTMVTGMSLIQDLTDESRLNEGMTLAVTALLTGIATGSATGGWSTDHLTPTTAYATPAIAACLALILTLRIRPRTHDGQAAARKP